MFTIAEAMDKVRSMGMLREPESPREREVRLKVEIRLMERYLERLKRELAALEMEGASPRAART